MKKALAINYFKIFIAIICISNVNIALSQSFRGLAALSEFEMWTSGSKGTVLFTNNSGISFDTLNPVGFSRKDFRDIHAVNNQIAIIMSAGDSAVILKTTNHGKTWKTVYADNRPGIFLDVLEINSQTGVGIALGDPLPDSLFNHQLNHSNTKHFVALYTSDFGDHWYPLPNGSWNLATENLSSIYAASGTSLVYNLLNLQKTKTGNNVMMDFYFAGGGNNAGEVRQVILTFNPNKLKETFEFLTFPYQLKFPNGEGWGIYGMQLVNNRLFCTGGHWKYPNTKDSFSYVIELSKVKYTLKNTEIQSKIAISHTQLSQNGYRSGIAIQFNPKSKEYFGIAVGSNGIDKLSNMKTTSMSLKNKNLIDQTLSNIKGINTCQWSGNALWVVGNKGQVIKFQKSLLFPRN